MKIEIGQYIEDIVALAERKSQLDQILYDINTIAEKIDYKSVADVGDDVEKRKQIIESELGNLGSQELAGYFAKMLERDNVALFDPSRFKMFAEQFEEEVKKIVYFKMTTSIELRKKDLTDIAQRLSKKVGRKVMLDLTVDKAIIGGAIIQKDNYILDFSVKSKIQNLGTEWKKSILRAVRESKSI